MDDESRIVLGKLPCPRCDSRWTRCFQYVAEPGTPEDYVVVSCWGCGFAPQSLREADRYKRDRMRRAFAL
jgi:hypothetical protein